jgi:hypothetical protein
MNLPNAYQIHRKSGGTKLERGHDDDREALYAEKDEPHPQDLVEWGLMKLKPCRINVSS